MYKRNVSVSGSNFPCYCLTDHSFQQAAGCDIARACAVTVASLSLHQVLKELCSLLRSFSRMTAAAAAAGAATPAPAAQQQRLWYFAYGSMCNPVSLSRRKLFPTGSHPASLSGYRVVFNLGGMANIIVDPDSICHGVLHRVTQPEFAVLQEIESNYATVQVPVVPYKPFSVDSSSSTADHVAAAQPFSAAAGHSNGTACAPEGPEADDSTDTDSAADVVLGSPVTATAFIVHPESLAAMAQQHPDWGNSLPSDRYIRIITAGLRHYGADPAWVEKIACEPCKHGRQPHEYIKLPAPDAGQQQDGHVGGQAGSSGYNGSGCSNGSAQMQEFTMQQLAQFEGKLQDGKVIFAVGRKVAELDVSAKPDGPMVAILQKHYAGRQIAFHMCMMLQEPRLPPISTPADLQQEHIDWAEDMVMEFTTGYGHVLRQIGWLEGQAVPDGGVEAAAAAQAAAVKDAAEALHEEDEATTAPETGVWR